MHELDIVGTLTVFQRKHRGALQPPCIVQGGQAGRLSVLTPPTILAAYAQGKGIPQRLLVTCVGRAAQRLVGGLAGHRFGHMSWRLGTFATGLGTLTDPATLNVELEIAGNWSVE